MKNKRGQQEIVGFVLIVVLVVVGLMVFLIISIRSSGDEAGSLEVANMLDAIMKQTTDCAIVYEPDYDDFEELIKSCYKNNKCSNLNIGACDYLNESLRDVLDGVFATEATISAYQIDFYMKDDDGAIVELVGFPKIFDGECVGIVKEAQKNIVVEGGIILVRMKICNILE